MDIDTSVTTPSDATDRPGLTRAEGLWFADCGLIIQAESTLFRISRDFLAVHSPVFRDMLSLPPPKDTDMMDGCPFVLLPDRAEDVTVFLKALLYPDFFEPYPAPTTLSILTGILRMSHKYEVDTLRKRSSCTSRPYIQLPVIARELHIDWILPAAFYRVCDFTRDTDILSGPLELGDKLRCITGCRVLETAGVAKILEFLWSPFEIPGCDSTSICFRNRSGTWEDSDWDRLNVCDVCLASMKIAHRRGRGILLGQPPEGVRPPRLERAGNLKTEALK
ncbi:hypothetical protein B0H13DRAFT_2055784 [Mycena leptocephala]|nr:hypothetical protein B0H13DRAFT_2055784 [Mycena leptocephala]